MKRIVQNLMLNPTLQKTNEDNWDLSSTESEYKSDREIIEAYKDANKKDYNKPVRGAIPLVL